MDKLRLWLAGDDKRSHRVELALVAGSSGPISCIAHVAWTAHHPSVSLKIADGHWRSAWNNAIGDVVGELNVSLPLELLGNKWCEYVGPNKRVSGFLLRCNPGEREETADEMKSHWYSECVEADWKCECTAERRRCEMWTQMEKWQEFESQTWCESSVEYGGCTLSNLPGYFILDCDFMKFNQQVLKEPIGVGWSDKVEMRRKMESCVSHQQLSREISM
ncbi:hypothetical protein Tco_0221675 [Tanacetum coccineum]